jgi:Tfp pilus assembly protein PilV
MHAGAHQRPGGRREDGWIIVEVVWSALILLIVVSAVLTALNTSTAASGLSRSRSVATTLAEQDQERLRSYRAVDLSNFYETRTVGLGARTYFVTSLTEWVRDSNGEPVSCTNGTVNADYLLVSSSVTSPTLAGRTARIRTLFAPPVGSFGPTQGTLAVKLEDYLAAPVPNVDVAITGPDSALLPTNGLGCAIFGYIPALDGRRPGGDDDRRPDRCGFVHAYHRRRPAVAILQQRQAGVRGRRGRLALLPLPPRGSNQAPPLQAYSEPQGCANVYVSGTYAGNLTIASEKDIVIRPPTSSSNGNVIRSGDVMLGLIANNFVRVYHKVSRSDSTSMTSCTNTNSSSSPLMNTVTIEAAILSLSHSFIADNHACGNQLGALKIVGAIAQRFRGPVGTFGLASTGFTKDYT